MKGSFRWGVQKRGDPDPPWGSMIYTIRVLESRTRGSIC